MRIFILSIFLLHNLFLLARNDGSIIVKGIKGKDVQNIKDSIALKSALEFSLGIPHSTVNMFDTYGRIAQTPAFSKVFKSAYTMFLKSSGAYDPTKFGYLNFWLNKPLDFSLSKADTLFLDSIAKKNILSGFVEHQEFSKGDTFTILQTEDFPFKIAFREIFASIQCQLLDEVLYSKGFRGYIIRSENVVINRTELPYKTCLKGPLFKRPGEKSYKTSVVCPPNKCLTSNSISPSLCISNRTGLVHKTNLSYCILQGDYPIETQCMTNAVLYKGKNGIQWIKDYFSMFEVVSSGINE